VLSPPFYGFTFLSSSHSRFFFPDYFNQGSVEVAATPSFPFQPSKPFEFCSSPLLFPEPGRKSSLPRFPYDRGPPLPAFLCGFPTPILLPRPVLVPRLLSVTYSEGTKSPLYGPRFRAFPQPSFWASSFAAIPVFFPRPVWVERSFLSVCLSLPFCISINFTDPSPCTENFTVPWNPTLPSTSFYRSPGDTFPPTQL